MTMAAGNQGGVSASQSKAVRFDIRGPPRGGATEHTRRKTAGKWGLTQGKVYKDGHPASRALVPQR